MRLHPFDCPARRDVEQGRNHRLCVNINRPARSCFLIWRDARTGDRRDKSAGEIYHRNPTFLPDGRRFLFVVQGADNTNGIHIGSDWIA
jgi:hypothetical protein